jgi:hypothetical protein
MSDFVIPANAGIHTRRRLALAAKIVRSSGYAVFTDSRLRGNDG